MPTRLHRSPEFATSVDASPSVFQAGPAPVLQRHVRACLRPENRMRRGLRRLNAIVASRVVTTLVIFALAMTLLGLVP